MPRPHRPARSPSRPLARALLGGVLAHAASCGGGADGGQGAGGGAPAGVHASLASGAASLEVDTGKGEVDLALAGRVLLRFPLDALELGTVPAVDDATNYDPYRIWVPHPLYAPLDGLAWVDPTGVTVAGQTSTSLTLDLAYPAGQRATLHFDAAAPGRFDAKLTPAAGGPAVAFFRLRPRADAKEGFYGLGETYDDVNQRGKVRAMQLEIDPSTESSDNEAHVPVPLLLGSTGWGLFVESPYPGAFSVAKDAPDLVEAAFGTGTASSKGLAFHLFAEPKPLDLTRHYYDITGYPRLPARWALGPWVWRNENKDQAEVEADLAAMRDKDLPTTAYWLDRPYATAVESFDFDPAKFTDPKAMIAKAHALGFRMALWQAPYVEDAPTTKALRAEAEAKGYYPPQAGLVLKKEWGDPIDLTNPDAYAWWQGHVRFYTDLGIEGFKLDYAEDVLVGLTSQRNEWRFHDGSDERTMHALFQPFYHRVYGETLPASGGFLLCRGGTYGDQKNVSVIWPGDLDARLVRMGDHVTEGKDSWVAVGGLAASMIAGLGLGPSGFPFYGADTGGYRHSPPDKETFTRWFEQTALSTVMQVGNGSSTVAWEPDATTGFDAEMLGWYRTYTRLHLRLFPYEWTYAMRLAKDGRPIERPLGLAFPELGVHPSDEYMFGDHLLVAPVLEKGATKRDVLLPPGRWIDWWTGEAHDGPGTITVPAPLGTLPLYIAGGGIVPLLRPTIDAIAPTTDPARVDSFATTPGVLYARVAAAAAGSPASTFELFDGTTLGASTDAAGRVTLTSKSGGELVEGALFELAGLHGKPSAVTSEGAPLAERAGLAALEASPSGWAFDGAPPRLVYVKLPAGARAAIVTP
jgi:alpha-D-xyloside xylohydrolase